MQKKETSKCLQICLTFDPETSWFVRGVGSIACSPLQVAAAAGALFINPLKAGSDVSLS
jgi:hypothetical protein